jgi:hypothetical protein
MIKRSESELSFRSGHAMILLKLKFKVKIMVKDCESIIMHL